MLALKPVSVLGHVLSVFVLWARVVRLNVMILRIVVVILVLSVAVVDDAVLGAETSLMTVLISAHVVVILVVVSHLVRRGVVVLRVVNCMGRLMRVLVVGSWVGLMITRVLHTMEAVIGLNVILGLLVLPVSRVVWVRALVMVSAFVALNAHSVGVAFNSVSIGVTLIVAALMAGCVAMALVVSANSDAQESNRIFLHFNVS